MTFNPLRREPHVGRVEQRLGGARRGRRVRPRARHRHRRLDPDPGGVLRHRRAEADVRPRPGRGRVPALAVVRPRRHAHAHGRADGGAPRRARRPAVRAAPGAGGCESACCGASWTTPTSCRPCAIACREAFERLGAAGFELVDVDMPELDLVDDALGAIVLREAWDVHRQLFEQRGGRLRPRDARAARARGGIGDEAYRGGLADRERVAAGFAARLRAGRRPRRADGRVRGAAEDPPVGTPEGDVEGRFTGPYNLAGNPAVSLPCGLVEGNLPAGLQLAAAVGAGRAAALGGRASTRRSVA